MLVAVPFVRTRWDQRGLRELPMQQVTPRQESIGFHQADPHVAKIHRRLGEVGAGLLAKFCTLRLASTQDKWLGDLA